MPRPLDWHEDSKTVLPHVSLTAGLLLFCTLIGGTTTVRTVGLLGSVSGATHATRGSQFWLLSPMKRCCAKGLLLWPDASEAGELSTVSQPLSCSSSDILLGCLQGEVLDWAEAEELVLSVLSGLLREQTLSILTVL